MSNYMSNNNDTNDNIDDINNHLVFKQHFEFLQKD